MERYLFVVVLNQTVATNVRLEDQTLRSPQENASRAKFGRVFVVEADGGDFVVPKLKNKLKTR